MSTVDAMCKLRNGFYYFDEYGESILWEFALSAAEPFIPLNIKEIDIVMPNPYEQGSLIIASDAFYRSDKYPFEVLQEYSDAYSFPDYTVMSSCLRSFGAFGGYKSPWLNPFFTLCPLEGINHSIWINPLRIHEINTQQEKLFATLISGQIICLPIQRRSLFQRIDLTCLSFATLRRDCFYFTNRGDLPINYLSILNTPFAHVLLKRPLLQRFPISYGKLIQGYSDALLYHSYEQLDYDNWQLKKGLNGGYRSAFNTIRTNTSINIIGSITDTLFTVTLFVFKNFWLILCIQIFHSFPYFAIMF